MERIAVTRISKTTAKSNFSYPYIRLPKDHLSIVGNEAEVFQTVYNGYTAYLIVTDSKVAQPVVEVAQRGTVKNEDYSSNSQDNVIKEILARLNTLEQCSSMKTEGLNAFSSEKALKQDGLEEIRTPDLRRVKATS